MNIMTCDCFNNVILCYFRDVLLNIFYYVWFSFILNFYVMCHFEREKTDACKWLQFLWKTLSLIKSDEQNMCWHINVGITPHNIQSLHDHWPCQRLLRITLLDTIAKNVFLNCQERLSWQFNLGFDGWF